MKHSKTIIFTLALSILIISTVSATENNKKVEEASESKCGDSCQECQRAVYQMKFQGSADCEVNGACRNTCYKVKEAWGTPFNPFEPFVKDVFGKCEICFRAGHCTISQCKEQERNEIEVINHVINSAHFSARVNPELLVAFPFEFDANADVKVAQVNKKVAHILRNELKSAVSAGSTQYVVPQVQNLVSSYFNNPLAPVQGNAYAVLNGPIAQVSSAAISFNNASDNSAVATIKQTKKIVEKIGQNVKEISKLKKEAGKGHKNDVVKVIKKEKNELNRLNKKVNSLSNKLQKKEKVLTKLANSPSVAQNVNTKNAINNSLNQVKQYSAAVNSVKADLRQNTQILKNNRH